VDTVPANPIFFWFYVSTDIPNRKWAVSNIVDDNANLPTLKSQENIKFSILFLGLKFSPQTQTNSDAPTFTRNSLFSFAGFFSLLACTNEDMPKNCETAAVRWNAFANKSLLALFSVKDNDEI
jgi:hypothetical protein